MGRHATPIRIGERRLWIAKAPLIREEEFFQTIVIEVVKLENLVEIQPFLAKHLGSAPAIIVAVFKRQAAARVLKLNRLVKPILLNVYVLHKIVRSRTHSPPRRGLLESHVPGRIIPKVPNEVRAVAPQSVLPESLPSFPS